MCINFGKLSTPHAYSGPHCFRATRVCIMTLIVGCIYHTSKNSITKITLGKAFGNKLWGWWYILGNNMYRRADGCTNSDELLKKQVLSHSALHLNFTK